MRNAALAKRVAAPKLPPMPPPCLLPPSDRRMALGSLKSPLQDRGKFKDSIVKGIDEELGKFGITVYSANVKDLEDSKG